MKQSWNLVKNILTWILLIVTVFMLLFTVVSVSTFNRSDKSIFGYKAYIVLSDSMSATDFKAGDLILIRDVDADTLKEGDIISYISQNPDSFGQTITHKIRYKVTDANGNPGFITYGTTTGVDDEYMVYYNDIIGQYRMNIPVIGRLFNFLKTVPGYIMLILVPFLILIAIRSADCVKLFKQYKAEMNAEAAAKLAEEQRKLEEERAEIQRMQQELQELREQLKIQGKDIES
jgi:signal peptidase